MKWIKYQVMQCMKNDEPVLINKKVGYNAENLAIAQNEAYDGYEIIEDGESINKEPLAIELGGTGANTAKEARLKLGVREIYFSQTKPTDWKHGDIWLCPMEE